MANYFFFFGMLQNATNNFRTTDLVVLSALKIPYVVASFTIEVS